MLKEFKEFALKGNFFDMAVGIIIGAAFSTIVRSLVDDILMQPLGVVTGGIDFSNKRRALRLPRQSETSRCPYHQFRVVH